MDLFVEQKAIFPPNFFFRIGKFHSQMHMRGDGELIFTPGTGVIPRPGGAPFPVKGPRLFSEPLTHVRSQIRS